jgi:hypothetical protein
LSIPCGIHKPEENFGRAVDRLAEMEFCSLRQAQNRLALFFFSARYPSGDLARKRNLRPSEATIGTQNSLHV